MLYKCLKCKHESEVVPGRLGRTSAPLCPECNVRMVVGTEADALRVKQTATFGKSKKRPIVAGAVRPPRAQMHLGALKSRGQFFATKGAEQVCSAGGCRTIG